MRLGTAETLAFVLRWLPPAASVLEVGCGDGELAEELQKRGFRVIGIDSDPEAVDAARRRSVDARLASWPGQSGGEPPHSERFDAILFTRSLHHIDPLDAAVVRARETGDMILIEDFALTEVSESFVRWLRGKVAEWEAHDVHPFASIRSEVAKHFRITHQEQVPYCYRYFDAPDDLAIYKEEKSRGELLGRRLVGTAGVA
ncbi:MAG TPA: class I SAM-dependent methyltransferase [Thermoanaerobaculia bacterium]|nr:class I SAM-dependent methyltransferase [Thermoanaerobaculia bacterium]